MPFLLMVVDRCACIRHENREVVSTDIFITRSIEHVPGGHCYVAVMLSVYINAALRALGI